VFYTPRHHQTNIIKRYTQPVRDYYTYAYIRMRISKVTRSTRFSVLRCIHTRGLSQRIYSFSHISTNIVITARLPRYRLRLSNRPRTICVIRYPSVCTNYVLLMRYRALRFVVPTNIILNFLFEKRLRGLSRRRQFDDCLSHARKSFVRKTPISRAYHVMIVSD